MSCLLNSNYIYQSSEPKIATSLENVVNLPNLPSALLSRIFQFLSITGLQRVTTVCKHWQLLGSEDSLRKIVLAKILNGTKWESSHEVIAAYHIEHFEEAQFVFLGEEHDTVCQRINSSVINEISGIGSIALFLEGGTTMKALTPSQRAFVKKYLFIHSKLMSNIQMFGWDMDPKAIQQRKLVVWERERDGERELPQNKVKVLNASIKECQSIIASIAPEFSTEKYVVDEADDLVKMVIHAPQLSEKDYRVFESNLDQLLNLVSERETQNIQDIMPERTQCATLTVQATAQLQKDEKLPQKAVFVLGRGHLKQGFALGCRF